MYPDAEFVLLVGTDMFLTLEQWYDAEFIMQQAIIAAFQRSPQEQKVLEAKAAELKKSFGACVELIETQPIPAASTDIRAALQNRGGKELLTDEVYASIVKNRLYGVKVDFDWLRGKAYAMLKPKRIPHVMGCEEEAIRLAERWGADRDKAAEAAILHDCTKKKPLPEQLKLCEKYGIEVDAVERVSEKLLHAKTGAMIAKRKFGADSDVVDAIRWHTTGRADMTLLEKIVYMADYIEPNRAFEGVETLRGLAYEDLDRAMLLGFEMSLEDVRAQGTQAHENTLAALKWYKERSV